MCRSPLILFFFVLVLIPLTAFADFYKYLDEIGVVNVTNDYNSIPERYRSGVTVVKESDLRKKSQTREKQVRDGHVRAEGQRPQGGITTQARTLPESASSATEQIVEKAGTASENPSSNRSSGWFERQSPLLKIVALIAFIAFAVMAGKLISSQVPRTLGVIIRIALFAGVIIYVFNAYADKLAKTFAIVKSKSDVVQKSVDKRSELIEKQAADR